MSSPWNGLLESLHSAFIDELNERYPDEKPTLGLPIKKRGLESPEDAQCVCRVGVELRGEARKGVVFIAVSDPGRVKAADKLDQFLEAMLKRAQSGFERRGLVPLFGSEAPQHVSLSIWIPIELRTKWYIGVGV